MKGRERERGMEAGEREGKEMEDEDCFTRTDSHAHTQTQMHTGSETHGNLGAAATFASFLPASLVMLAMLASSARLREATYVVLPVMS